MEQSRRAPFPYDGLAPRAVWKQSVARLAPAQIDPQGDVPFTIDRTMKIASAGSCFAGRIAAALRQRGYNYSVTEPGPADLSPEERLRRGYGDYTARFGNVYTTVQLLQLLQRALGRFEPVDDVWARAGGGFVDPLRPRVEPDGFATPEAMRADRALHLAAVRRMFEESDVLVFTLGLTESWRSRADGTAFPAPPGREFGTWDDAAYYYENLGVAANVAALSAFVELARSVNPGLQIILTVSPVPLVATKEDAHVLAATTYSKSVLRVAAEEVCNSFAGVTYFASYEVVTGTFNTAAYYEADRRNVTPAGVEHVMRVFFRHFGEERDAEDAPRATVARVAPAGGVLGAARAPHPVDDRKDPCGEDVLEEYIAREFGEALRSAV